MKQSRFAAIDGLRAVAIIMVTLLHMWSRTGSPAWHIGSLDLSPLFTHGYAGVSLFFALSGFCLFNPIVKNNTYEANWLRFYIRRCFRILPPYWTALIIWGLLRPDTIAENPAKHILMHLSFLHILSWDTSFSFTGVLWSLATEEQFYWFFPLTALLVFRKPKHMFIGAAVLSIGGQFLAYRLLGTQIGGQLQMQMPLKIFDFVCGMIPAVLLAKGENRYTGIAWVIGLFGLFGAPYVRSLCPEANYMWVDMFFSPTWGALIYASLASPKTIFAKILSFKPLAFIGLISYSMYLYNVLMDEIPARLFPHIIKGSSIWWIVASIAVFLGGFLGYYLIEKPSIHFRERFEKRVFNKS